MADVRETIAVDGIHCMNCIPKIAAAIGGVEGVRAGSATLAGDVHLVYDDASPGVRGRVVDALRTAGFAVAAEGEGEARGGDG